MRDAEQRSEIIAENGHPRFSQLLRVKSSGDTLHARSKGLDWLAARDAKFMIETANSNRAFPIPTRPIAFEISVPAVAAANALDTPTFLSVQISRKRQFFDQPGEVRLQVRSHRPI
jgi:hypothetical protein